MSRVSFFWWIHITILICFITSIVQINKCSGVNVDSEDDFASIEIRKKPHRRKSPRLAFIEETKDPMFKFLTKMLSTAQLRSKSALARAQNGINKTKDLTLEITEVLKENHLF